MANWMSRAQEALGPHPDGQAVAEHGSGQRYCWILYRRGQPPLEVRFLPEVTRTEAEARYPGAIAKEPEGEAV